MNHRMIYCNTLFWIGKEALLAEENKLASMFVPNRVEVKKKSAMNAANALKKIEQEVRNKALASRLHEGHADTGEARLRAQTIYSEKYFSFL